MLAQPVALTNEQHADLKILPRLSFENLTGRHMAPLMLQEFPAAAHHYPIFFIKDEQNNTFTATAVFGLKDGENVFIENDAWVGGYLPASLRGYPFTLARAGEEQLILCVNEQADIVSKTEGQALFTADGKPTEFFEGINTFFKEFIDANNVSTNIMTQLAELGLFRADGLQYRNSAGEEKRVNGFYVIDREKLDALTDEQFLSLRKFGVLPAIYAHFSSLERISEVIRRLPAA
jgi:hypothetical protein